MDSKASSKGNKKSQNSNRKKKKNRKRESGRGNEQSPGAGKNFSRETHRSLSGAPGKDSGADTDSKDSGLEADCRPNSDRTGPRPNGAIFESAQHKSLVSTLETETQVTVAKRKTESPKNDARTKQSSNKDKNSATKDKLSKQQNNNHWATPTGNISEKSSHSSSRAGGGMPSIRSSLPNISHNRNELTGQGGRSYARGSTSVTSVPSSSSLPMVVQICQESLRWEHELEDSDEEAERIRVYKVNRRKRYIAASNEKYEDWLSSASNTSLSGVSGKSRNSSSKSAKDVDSNHCTDSHNIHANLVSSNKTVTNMYDEYSHLVFSHPQTNTGHRIVLNC